MRKKALGIIATCAVVALTVLAGCMPANNLKGKWKPAEETPFVKSDVIEFTEDKYIETVDMDFGEAMGFKVHVVTTEKYKIATIKDSEYSLTFTEPSIVVTGEGESFTSQVKDSITKSYTDNFDKIKKDKVVKMTLSNDNKTFTAKDGNDREVKFNKI